MSDKKAPTFILRENYPCHGQTPEQIQAYYRAVQVGDLMCVRHTQGGVLIYQFLRVERLHRGRVYPPQESGISSFWAKTGANCFHPQGQTTLVVPSEAIIAYTETHEMRPFTVRIQPTADEARALLKEVRS